MYKIICILFLLSSNILFGIELPDDILTIANAYVEDPINIFTLDLVCGKYYKIDVEAPNDKVLDGLKAVSGTVDSYNENYKEYVINNKKGIVNQFINAIVFINEQKDKEMKRILIDHFFSAWKEDLSNLFNIDTTLFVERFNKVKTYLLNQQKEGKK